MEKNYKKLCPFKGWVLENFPFIEADFDAITNYELLCKIVEYLNKTSSQFNDMIDNINYLNSWFDNLDVQDEVDNKLDEMVESGQLQEIITDYLNSKAIFGFDNVASMKSATNLIDGSYAETLGYYEKNDGGSGLYKIREITNSDTVDEATIIALNNENLIAELIIKNNTINLKQLGGKSYKNDQVKFDNATIFNKYKNLYSNNRELKLHIDSGIYMTSGVEFTSNGLNIEGEGAFDYNLKNNGTTLIPYQNNQDYIFKIGNINNQTEMTQVNLNGISFSTYEYGYKNSNLLSCTTGLKIVYVFGGNVSVNFFGFKGNPLEVTNSYEITFDKLLFRDIDSFNNYVINFGTATKPNGNLSALSFNKLYFEGITANAIIHFAYQSNFINSNFGTINFEDYPTTIKESVVYSEINGSFNTNTANHRSIFKAEKGAYVSFEVNNIELNNFAYRYSTFNNQQYIFDMILDHDSGFTNIIFNNILTIGCKKNIIMYNKNNTNISPESLILYNNLVLNDSPNFKYVINSLGTKGIKINNIYDYEGSNKRKYVYENVRDYNLNITRYIGTGYYGNEVYDIDALNHGKLCLALLNTIANTDIDRRECYIPLKGKTIHVRAKVWTEGTTSSSPFTFQLFKTGNSTALKTVTISNFDHTFKWYSANFDDVTLDSDMADYYVSITPTNNVNGQTLLDCLYFSD